MTALNINAALQKRTDWKSFGAEWWPVLIGLLVLYLPSFTDLANGPWSTPDQAHGPIILTLVLFLWWQARPVLLQPAAGSRPLPGSIVLVFGLLCYALGRSQDVQILEIGSLVPVMMGVLLIARGENGLRKLWFAIVFMLFLVPLPGAIIDAVTGPLKTQISIIAEAVLYRLGYPIARSGATIVIGAYQLLVADACSGLHSMFSLSALGLFYLHLKQHRNWLRNGLIAASILPIAFAANVVRVMLLVLVTYHLGDAAGQGFLHGFAGMVMFVAALCSLFLLDGVFGWLLGWFRPRNPRQAA